MKKSIFLSLFIMALALSMVGFSTESFAQRGYGMHHGMGWWGPQYGPPGEYGRGGEYGPRGEWNYCPYCGRSFQGRGGYGMGPGMMRPEYGHGYGHGYGYSDPYRRGYPRMKEPLDESTAREMVQDLLDSSGNPNLKLGGIENKGDYFEAEIVTKDGSLVDKLAVDKETGRMRSIY